MIDTVDKLIRRVRKTQHGFAEIQAAADEAVAANGVKDSMRIAKALYASEVYQARAAAAFILGRIAAQSADSLKFLKTRVSKDRDWRVQEILAKAFDRYCSDIGYRAALPIIKAWLADPNPNVRRAVTEGLRIWTGRSFFCDHPEIPVRLLSRLKDDDSEYVRKSVGNALRDISKKHRVLVKDELQKWDVSQKNIMQTYKLASRFLGKMMVDISLNKGR